MKCFYQQILFLQIDICLYVFLLNFIYIFELYIYHKSNKIRNTYTNKKNDKKLSQDKQQKFISSFAIDINYKQNFNIFRIFLKNNSNSYFIFVVSFQCKIKLFRTHKTNFNRYFCILILILVLVSRIDPSKIFYNYINILYKIIHRRKQLHRNIQISLILFMNKISGLSYTI